MTDKPPIPIRGSGVSILILDPQAIVREGLIRLLSPEQEFSVCAEVAGPEEAFAAMHETDPDLILMEVAMAGEQGLEFIQAVSREEPELPILVLSNHDEMLYAERALRAGAHGFLTKGASRVELLDAVRTVASGGFHVSEQIRDRLVERIAGGTRGPAGHPLDVLTDRELQVFRLLGRGHSTREVGELLEISSKTVETHRAKIMRKLDLDNASQLVHRAIAWTRFGEPDEGAMSG